MITGLLFFINHLQHIPNRLPTYKSVLPIHLRYRPAQPVRSSEDSHAGFTFTPTPLFFTTCPTEQPPSSATLRSLLPQESHFTTFTGDKETSYLMVSENVELMSLLDSRGWSRLPNDGTAPGPLYAEIPVGNTLLIEDTRRTTFPVLFISMFIALLLAYRHWKLNRPSHKVKIS